MAIQKPQTKQAIQQMAPAQWWLGQQTSAAVEQIKASQAVERERLEFQKDRFNEVLGMYKSAFGELGGDGGFSVPSEFSESAALFRPGGQFGVGAKAEIERGGQQAIAAGQVGFARTGMSSGTNVAGLSARVSADTALSRAKVEGERVSRLGGSLVQVGQAKQSAQELAARRETALLSSLSSFGRV